MSLTPPGDAKGPTVPGSNTPGQRVRVLIVDRDPSSLAGLRAILRAQEWEVISVRTGAEALEVVRLERPDTILTELELDDMGGADLCRALRRQNETANTPVIVLSNRRGVEERVASLSAGAFDYLVKPPDAEELVARVWAALHLRKEKAGVVVTVLGSKGGVGASVIAANLAVALRQETRQSVALLDAAGLGATADVMLNLQPNPGIARLCARLDELEQADFEAMLIPHTTGLEALLLQETADDLVPPEEMRKLLLALRRIRDLVVVDASLWREAVLPLVLELADWVVLVMTPEITAVRAAKRFLERAGRMGLSRERVMLALNRYPQPGGLARRDIEAALGIHMQVCVPDDAKLVTYSINQGQPVVQSRRRSGVARQVIGLAQVLKSALLQLAGQSMSPRRGRTK